MVSSNYTFSRLKRTYKIVLVSIIYEMPNVMPKNKEEKKYFFPFDNKAIGALSTHKYTL